MNATGIDALVHRVRPAAEEPQGALVLLHGRGTDENDLFPVLDFLDPERRLVGVTPRAPLSLPPAGRHWYAIRSLGYPEPTTFLQTAALLASFLDALPRELGVPWERTILGGFSQGTVMSYALGLGVGRPSPAGLLALSGFVPTVEGYELDLASRRTLPVLIAHGAADPVIPVEFARAARDRLEAAGLNPRYLETASSHTIDPRLLPQLQSWISATVPDASAVG